MESSKFFNHGEVKVGLKDLKSRQVQLEICLPCILFQTITPVILGFGFVDSPKIKQPFAVWIPRYSKERINPAFVSEASEDRVNTYIKNNVLNLMGSINSVSQVFMNPTDLIPMMPLGTYIEFKMKCKIDDILKIIEGIQKIDVVGILELQLAFSEILKSLLEEIEEIQEFKAKRLGTTT